VNGCYQHLLVSPYRRHKRKLLVGRQEGHPACIKVSSENEEHGRMDGTLKSLMAADPDCHTIAQGL